jgi:hypothetical protein
LQGIDYSVMRNIITPIIAVLSIVIIASTSEARTYKIFGGAAQITLPKGASLQPFNNGSTKGLQVIFSKQDSENRAYIERKSISKSRSDAAWRGGVVKYYNKLFKKYKGYKKNRLRGSARQVVVDYQYTEGKMSSRDYTKYMRANKTTQVQAYYFSLKPSKWNDKKARQLRAVVDSLRPGK